MNASAPLTNVPVLIAGAGPAGLVAAITLSRYGIETLVVERRRQPSTEPRANLVSTGSMELFRSWGLEPAIRDASPEIVFTGLMGETLASADEEIPLGVPTPEQAAVVSPSVPLGATQDAVEPILRRHFATAGVGGLEWETELVGIAERDGLVRATIRGPAGERVVEARYVIGADGVRSRVRDLLAIGLSGPGRVMDAANALFRAPLGRLLGAGPRRPIYPITHPAAPDGVFVTVSKGDRWGYGFTGEPDSIDPAEVTAEAMARRIRVSAGADDLDLRIERVRRFSYEALIAERFRGGDVFLAGDAAHRVTPRGGTGMNTAIRDGRDLGWKLAWVLDGRAGVDLLDTYERERRPVAEHNMRRSVDPNGSVRSVAEELHVDIGPRIPHVWVEPGRSTLDLLGPGFTVLSVPAATAARATAVAAAGPAPVKLRQVDAITARALGIGADGAMLVRPDGVAAGSWSQAWPAATRLASAPAQ